MASAFEALMVICFGISWPLNIVKAWKARTAKGTSIHFCLCIWIGYVFGILSKVVYLSAGKTTPFYVWFFYILNIIMVSVGIAIYFRNVMLDRKAEEK